MTGTSFQDQWMIGHPGMGGQNVKMDPTNKVAFAYISNSVKWGISDYVVTFMRLQNALYQCLNEQNLLGDDSNDVTLVTDVQSAIDATETIVETDKLLADQRNATKTPSTPVSNADNSAAQKPTDQPLQKPKTERTATPSPIQQAKTPVTAKSVAPSSDTSLQTSDNGVKT
ncbi:unnamed protein product [Anisakis simplex]|uniref:Beta-lactamase domain-containing protein n=1 Tax=Anisakis simplex TaxID=6269 RepID=A0A0M3J4Q2_ANISI|nr:unnamed protein product [Anisakis simplex]